MIRQPTLKSAAQIVGAALVAATLLMSACAGPAVPSNTPSAGYSWRTPEPPPPSQAPYATPLPAELTREGVWAQWALLDRNTGMIEQDGGQPGTSTTESMIKVAIAAEYLRRVEQAYRELTGTEQHRISIMLRDSDNEAAESLYRAGGSDDMLQAVIATCNLKATTTKPGWWSETQMSAGDAARMGTCIASGRICTQEWVTWLLGEMRHVEGVGRFGIIEAHPQDDGRPLAIKNGYSVRDDGNWHVNCLAVADFWTLAVMTRYPAEWGIEFGAKLCAGIAAGIIPPDLTVSIEPSPTGTSV